MTVISPIYTFPATGWWMHAALADTVIFDGHEHFEKMTARNRYQVSGANNSILLSVPLAGGRNQHMPVRDVLIFNGAAWQVQHWRTLVSVYRRAPFFDYYADSLQALFETPYTHLAAFNRAGISWVKKQLNIEFAEEDAETYRADYPAFFTDLRKNQPEVAQQEYYQVFMERTGFIPGLSIIDLLFSEGPYARGKLRMPGAQQAG